MHELVSAKLLSRLKNKVIFAGDIGWGILCTGTFLSSCTWEQKCDRPESFTWDRTTLLALACWLKTTNCAQHPFFQDTLTRKNPRGSLLTAAVWLQGEGLLDCPHDFTSPQSQPVKCQEAVWREMQILFAFLSSLTYLSNCLHGSYQYWVSLDTNQ